MVNNCLMYDDKLFNFKRGKNMSIAAKTTDLVNAIKGLGNVISKRQTADDVKKLTYVPHPPTLDNDGKVETFAKYNFSYLVRGKTFYVFDNDGIPWFLFIANDGISANNGLFAAKDISAKETDSSFAFTNTPLTVPNVVGQVTYIAAADSTGIIVFINSRAYKVTTNGVYSSSASWTAVQLPVINGTFLPVMTDNGYVVSVILSANELVVTDLAGTIIARHKCFDLSWVSPGSGQTLVGMSASHGYSITDLCRVAPNEYVLVQTFWVSGNGWGFTFNGYCKFSIGTGGVVTWIINPQVAGWRADIDTPNNLLGYSNVCGLYYDESSKNFYQAEISQWMGYSKPIISKSPDFKVNRNNFIKYVSVPDTSPIAKSTSPGVFAEVLSDGTNHYVIQSGINNDGYSLLLYRAELKNGAPTVVPNGLPNGKTFDSLPIYVPPRDFFSARVDGRNRVYITDNANGKIQRLEFDLTTSKIKLTPVRTFIAPHTTNLPLSEQFSNFAYNPVTDTLYAITYRKTPSNDGYRLYTVSATHVYTLVADNIGKDVHPDINNTNICNSGSYINCDAPQPLLIVGGANDTLGGQTGNASSVNLVTGVSKGVFSYYPYNQNYSWNTALGKTVCAYASENHYTQLQHFVLQDDGNTVGSTPVAVMLPISEGLSGFINDGRILLGGYVTTILDAIKKAGGDGTFLLPANSTSYLYLTRKDHDKLIARVSKVNEPDTFFKVKIATFVTNGTGVTSSTAEVINHVTKPF
jgi:hypothetical protein